MNHAPQGAPAHADHALRGAYNHAYDLKGTDGYRAAIEDLIRVHALEGLSAALPELAQASFVWEACIQRIEREPWLIAEWEALFADYAPIRVAA